MSSRELILGKLRQRHEQPFPNSAAPTVYRPMVPLGDVSPEALQSCFINESEKVGAVMHQVNGPEAAISTILELLAEDKAVSCWEPAQIPLSGLAEALDAANIARIGQDANVRVGITGVEAALAATGSVVVTSGSGRYRATSLLPPVHIAVVKASRILPDLESWWDAQKVAGLEKIRKHSNIVVITGPSRTADIAMQLVMGMHGPREVHLVLLNN